MALPKRETDLYEPVRDYLVSNGYDVRSEVLGCDITAIKPGDLIIIEMKLRLSLDLLVQATHRQRIADSVYIAVPRTDDMGSGKKWWDIEHLLRRLELGLIVVSFPTGKPMLEVVFHPVPFARRRKRAGQRAVLKEIAGRTGDFNRGGSTGRRLVTAYRENAIHIACCLHRLGPMSPRALRALDTGPKTTPILYSNVYGWFERLDRALYGIASTGETALAEYPELVKRFRENIEGRTA